MLNCVPSCEMPFKNCSELISTHACTVCMAWYWSWIIETHKHRHHEWKPTMSNFRTTLSIFQYLACRSNYKATHRGAFDCIRFLTCATGFHSLQLFLSVCDSRSDLPSYQELHPMQWQDTQALLVRALSITHSLVSAIVYWNLQYSHNIQEILNLDTVL